MGITNISAALFSKRFFLIKSQTCIEITFPEGRIVLSRFASVTQSFDTTHAVILTDSANLLKKKKKKKKKKKRNLGWSDLTGMRLRTVLALDLLGPYAPKGSTSLLPKLSVTSKVSAPTSYAWVGRRVHFRRSEDVTLLEFTSPVDRVYKRRHRKFR